MSTPIDRPSGDSLSSPGRSSAALRLSHAERRGILWLGDVVVCGLAGVLGLWLWTFTRGQPLALVIAEFGRLMLVMALAWLVLAWAFDLYNPRTAARMPLVAPRLLAVAGLMLVAYLIVFFVVAPRNPLIRLPLVYFLALVTGLQLLWRWLLATLQSRGAFCQRAVIVGAGWAGRTIGRLLREQARPEFEVVGFIDDDESKHGTEVEGMPVLGAREDLLHVARGAGATTVIYAITHQLDGRMFQTLLDCQIAGLAVVRMPALYEALTGRVPVEHVRNEWMLPDASEGGQTPVFYRLFVRLVDLAFSVVAGVCLVVAGPLIALLIKADSPGPVLFRQTRSGRGGVPFELVKFRSMVADAEAHSGAQWAADDDPRVTRVGRFLRRTRLDELPQVLNILRGDIHLIGPRPERPEFISMLEKEIPFYRARLAVKPGLTGWAQVQYRYGNAVDDALIKLEYDLYYIKHRSISLDLRILFQTAIVMLLFKGT
jgi:exopolysaccharide biosynthesis polyprenyl glycosylphosphotransferase